MTSIPSWQSVTVLVIIAAIAWLVVYRLCGYTGATQTGRYPTPRAPRLAPAHIAGLCILALAALTAAVLLGKLDAIDSSVRAWVPTLYDTAFVQLCLFITSLGNTETLVAVTAVAIGLLWALDQRHEAAGLVVSAVGVEFTTFVMKYAIDRPRPTFEAFASAATPSFPSAHAGGAVAIYGFIVIAVANRLPARWRFEVSFWGAGFIIFLAATRVILGVHYLSDVIAGLLLGLIWLIAGCSTRARLRLR